MADGHVLNFQVINPFNGKPTRATLVGFLDWKSSALVGYEIMMTENKQCIASALRNAILNLGMIPKVVYQDNGKGFKAKFFQHCDFEEEGFNGVYANLGIHSVFARPYNARAKVIERYFLEFQEELEKGMPSYVGTSIEDKPAWMKRGEYLHRKFHERLTKGYVPTISEAVQYINGWLEFHNSQACPHDKNMTIKELSNRTSIPYSTVNDIVNERIELNNVRFGYVVSICDVLGITIAELQDITKQEQRILDYWLKIKGKKYYLSSNDNKDDIYLCKVNSNNDKYIKEIALWTAEEMKEEEVFDQWKPYST